MVWTSIPLTRFDDDTPIDEDFLGDIHDNQEELLLTNVDCRIDGTDARTTSGTYDNIVSNYVTFPSMLAVTSNTWQWKLAFEHQRSAGSASYDIRARINNGSWIEKLALGSSIWLADTFIFPDSEIKVASLQNQVLLEIEAKIVSTAFVEVRNLGGLSRVEMV